MHFKIPIDVTFEGCIYRYHGMGDWETMFNGSGGQFEEYWGMIPGEVVFAVRQHLKGPFASILRGEVT